MSRQIRNWSNTRDGPSTTVFARNVQSRHGDGVEACNWRTISRAARLSASTAEQRAPLGRLALAREFDEAATRAGAWPLTPRAPITLQINGGKLCNQTCRDAGPDRREVMTRDTMAQVPRGAGLVTSTSRRPDRRSPYTVSFNRFNAGAPPVRSTVGMSHDAAAREV